MKTKPSITAQKLLNLYRQYFAINGGWSAINKVLIAESTPEIIAHIKQLPTGDFLAEHIANLQSGKTPMSGIAQDLLPYNGLMETSVNVVKIASHDMETLSTLLRVFIPTVENLNEIKALPFIVALGDGWKESVAVALEKSAELSAIWDTVIKFDTASHLWFKAGRMLSSVPSERLRAEIQADMMMYENFLPMFGDAGLNLLNKLRDVLNTPEDAQSIATKITQ
jgi:hypothetical protein